MAKISKKDINLYALLEGPKKSTVKAGLIFGVAGIAAVVLMGGAFVGLKIYDKSQQTVIEELQAKTNDPVLTEKLNSVNELMNQISVLRSSGDVYKEVRLGIIQSQAYQDNFTPELIETLRSCETIIMSGEEVTLAKITGISYDGSVLRISVNSVDNRNISGFVDQLKRLELFSSITYNGYALASENGYAYEVDAVFYDKVYEFPEETTEQTTEQASQAAEEGTVS